MKLPIQAQPVFRNISTARISYGSLMIHPQECVPPWVALRECDWLKGRDPNSMGAYYSCRNAVLSKCDGQCCLYSPW